MKIIHRNKTTLALLTFLLSAFAFWSHAVAGPDLPGRPQEHSERHNGERFSEAYQLIHKGDYENALMLLKQNIQDAPNASDIDYDYAWATLCLGKLCRFEEFVKFYGVMRNHYYGPSRVEDRGVVRDWEKMLMDAKRALFECPDVNSQAMVKRLVPIDEEAERIYKNKLEELVRKAAMGNRSAAEELELRGASLAHLIATGDLVLAKDARLSDTCSITGFGIKPKILKSGSRTSLYLPSPMQRALRRFDSAFTVCSLANYTPALRDWYPYADNNLPFVVLGDFNGDSVQDAAIQGYTRSSIAIVTVLSSGSEFEVVPVDSSPLTSNEEIDGGLEIYLTHVGPGLIETSYEKRALHLTTDAFEICYFEKASTLYYYRDGKFHGYTTGD